MRHTKTLLYEPFQLDSRLVYGLGLAGISMGRGLNRGLFRVSTWSTGLARFMAGDANSSDLGEKYNVPSVEIFYSRSGRLNRISLLTDLTHCHQLAISYEILSHNDWLVSVDPQAQHGIKYQAWTDIDSEVGAEIGEVAISVR